MKRIIAIVLSTVMLFSMAACGGKKEETTDAPAASTEESAEAEGEVNKDDVLIGLAMPTHSDESWIRHSTFTQDYLKELGYSNFDEQFAEDVVATQVNQIENMITKGADVLIVAAIDGSALTDVLAKAAKQGIKVIAYDRLIMNTENVDCYITFDNFQVGVTEANYIVEKLDLENSDGPFNIELFGGSPDDNNSYFFYDGALSVLQPYIDSGKLVVKSGQTGMEACGIQGWDGALAQSRMDNLLTAYYSDGSHVDAVLAPYDGLSIGIISSLKNVGYGTDARPLPIVTGQDAEVASIQSIIAGEQTQTVWKDFRETAKNCAAMVDALIMGTEVPINDTETYDNGVKVVPSYLCEVKNIDAENYMELFDSGFYNKDESPWNEIIK